MPETNRYHHQSDLNFKTMLARYQTIMVNLDFWRNVFASGVAFSAIIATAVVNPYLLQNVLGLSPAKYGLWAFVAMLGMFFGMLSNGYLVTRLGISRMMFIGMLILLFLGGFSFVLFALSAHLSIVTVVVPTFFISMAATFILPNAMVGAFAPFAKMAGTAGAVYGFLQITVVSIVSLIISLVNKHTQLDIGIILMVVAFLSISFYFGVGSSLKYKNQLRLEAP